MFHNSRAIVALGREPNDTVYQKTLGVNDFYLATGGREWPLGNIQMLGKSNAEAMKGEEPKLTKLAPRGARRGRPARGGLLADHRGRAPPGTGSPWTATANIHLAYTQTNDIEADGLYRELQTILNHTGMAEHHVWTRTSTRT